MIQIRRVTKADPALFQGLTELLIDTVRGGASVGFLWPLSTDAAHRYWREACSTLGDGLLLWVAEADGRVVGAVLLAPCLKENGRHRAEVQKLMVHSAHRRQGIGKMLMAAVDNAAQDLGCTLLVLDT